MLNYIALIWDAQDTEKCEVARCMIQAFQDRGVKWQDCFQGPGLRILCAITNFPSADKVYRLRNDQGVIFGRLFERGYKAGSMPTEVELGERDSSEIVTSNGRTLVQNYWGQYIAFLCEQGTPRSWVLQDPTGGVPCLTARVRGIDIYFRRFEDGERLGLPPLTIDRQYLAGRLAYNAVCRRASGLNEVKHVLPGECIEHCRDRRDTSFLWNPLEIAASDVIEDVGEAVQRTRETARACVHAWASCYEGILLLLSGGLDSAIVLACLRDAPTGPRLVCQNNYTQGSNSDERVYARYAAERASCELFEKEGNRRRSLEVLKNVPRAASPFPSCVDLSEVAEEARFATERGLGSIFTGDGGDEIFNRSTRLPPSVDFAYVHRGLPWKLLSQALDDATLLHTSIWHVLKVVMEHGLARRTWSASDLLRGVSKPLLRLSVLESAMHDLDLMHPLFLGSPELPPAKIDQAYHMVLHGMHMDSPLIPESYPVITSPLISQPLLELSLRIPVYALMHGGRDRAVARLAFEHDLPPQIAWRKSKGGSEEFLKEMLHRNIHIVRELLLDGFLAQEGFLDRSKLEQVLSGGPTTVTAYNVELMHYLDVEAWARNWYGIECQAAA
jgi:asparagine synthase (glutamine-hydrolysing)